eukprot:6194026-Pleurochrysis_carterae.AAC.4
MGDTAEKDALERVGKQLRLCADEQLAVHVRDASSACNIDVECMHELKARLPKSQHVTYVSVGTRVVCKHIQHIVALGDANRISRACVARFCKQFPTKSKFVDTGPVADIEEAWIACCGRRTHEFRAKYIQGTKGPHKATRSIKYL